MPTPKAKKKAAPKKAASKTAAQAKSKPSTRKKQRPSSGIITKTKKVLRAAVAGAVTGAVKGALQGAAEAANASGPVADAMPKTPPSDKDLHEASPQSASPHKK